MNKMFYGLALSLMLCLVFAPAALADSPCVAGSLSSYVDSLYGGTASSNFSCSVTADGLTLDFSQFTYTPGGSTTEAASAIGAAPVTAPDGPGLQFNPGIPVNGLTSGTEDFLVGFTVTAESGGEIGDVYINLSNVSTSGTGVATYEEQFCNSQGTCSLYVENPITADSNVINLSNTALGGPVSSLTITKDVTLSAGSNGSAGLSGFNNEYSPSAVPEPRAVSYVLGLGLLAGFVIYRRRRVAQS